MGVFWLRVAAVCYSVGLLHAILVISLRRTSIFRVAIGAFYTGVAPHERQLTETAGYVL
ncbi:MAG: hypothetical protein ABSF98_12335 [Bryobacteraceae bacterium]